jgi:hypothetical protein
MADAPVVAPVASAAPQSSPSQIDAAPDAALAAPEGQELPKPEAPKPEPRRFKAKVNGRELDLSEDEVIESGLNAAQIRRAATAAFEEAKRSRAEYEALRRKVAESPEDALAELLGGHEKLDAIAEARLIRKLQLEQMDPNQRARMEAEQRAAEMEKRAKSLEDQQRNAYAEAQRQHYAQQFDREFGEALSTSGLPKTTETVRRMATVAKSLVERGIEFSGKQLATLVRQDILAEQAAMLGGLDGATLMGLLGADAMKKLRQADIARVKAARPAPAAPAKQQPRHSESNDPNPHLLSVDEWRKKMGIE